MAGAAVLPRPGGAGRPHLPRLTEAASTLERAFARHTSGDLQGAAHDYQTVLTVTPDHPEALYLFGCLAYQAGQFEAARRLLTRAVEVQPQAARAHAALGLLLADLADLDAADAAFAGAVGLDPTREHLAGLGRVRLRRGLVGEAVELLRRATRSAPPDTDVLCDLGDALAAADDQAGSAAAFATARALDPASARAAYGVGCAASATGDHATAAEAFGQAVELAPDDLRSRHNLGAALFQLGRVDEALAEFRRCAADAAGEASAAMAAVIAPGAPGEDDASVLALRRAWAAARLPPSGPRPPRRSGAGPLRVGYVSSFFHRPNWMKPVWALINRHDRARVAPYLFVDGPLDLPGYVAGEGQGVHSIAGLDNAQAADAVRAAGIDLLVDLNGYSRTGRIGLFCARPAPVTAGWFNMYATTGVEAYDWLIGDAQVIGADEERFYSERIARVSGSYLTFEVAHPAPDVVAAGPGRSFTFGSLASLYKITPQVIAAWSRILTGAPASRLLLRNAGLEAEAVRRIVLAAFASEGVAPSRLDLRGPAPHMEFLATYGEIDLALDVFPYNGGTTTTEAVWQGVPVLSFRGDRWASRTSASILRAGGLGDFVADDLEGYVAHAIDTATSESAPRRLADLRPGLRERLRGSSVCDVAGFTHEMEALYARMLAEPDRRPAL